MGKFLDIIAYVILMFFCLLVVGLFAFVVWTSNHPIQILTFVGIVGMLLWAVFRIAER